MFLRKPSIERDPLAVTMSGVRLGERVLQIGAGDPRLVARIAAKVGITGTAVIVVDDERSAAKMRSAASDAGAVADVHVMPLAQLPFTDGAFDVVVVHETIGSPGAPDGASLTRGLSECRRVLRPGGRVVAIEQTIGSGLRRLLQPRRPDEASPAGGTTPALQSAGFATVRMLAEREGYRFIEAFKPH